MDGMISDWDAAQLAANFRQQLADDRLVEALTAARVADSIPQRRGVGAQARIAARSMQLRAEWDEFQRRTNQRERIAAVLGPGPHRLSDLTAVYGRGGLLL